MKKRLLYLLAAAMAFPTVVSAESVAHGYQMGDGDNWFGFISFPVSQFANPTKDKRNYDETHVSAGECVDGIFYSFEVYPDVMGGVTAYNYRVRDAKTFEIIKNVDFYNDAHRVVDMTYDYTTNTMFALVENNYNSSSISLTSLNIVDLATGECYVVGSPGDLKAINGNNKEVPEALITLAADKDGQLYAMGEYRQFYKLDKMTGKATQIGSQHSIATTNQFQSMAFDTEGVLYWAQSHPDYGYFLTIDPATGVPSYMAEDPNPETKWENEGSKLGKNAEVTALWFEKTFDTTAPAPVGSLTAKPGEKAPNEITLTWSLPTVDLAGNNITVTAVKVYRLGSEEVIATLDADAVSFTDPAAPNGDCNYMVCVVAGEKQGRGALVKVFAGADMLNPVTDLNATNVGADVTITWKAPTTTHNGGYADFDNITYRVWRIIGDHEALIATDVKTTSYNDVLPGSGTYYYSVEPVSGGVIGYACDSEPVTYSETIAVPCTFTFEDDADGKLWSISNHAAANGWSIIKGYYGIDGKYAQLKSGPASDPCNDYMFSPAIAFTPGTYTLSYKVNGSVYSDIHSWSISLVDTPDVSAEILTEIEAHENKVVGGSWIDSDPATFTVPEGGTYYLMFHGTTSAGYCTLKFDNVTITKAPATIPYACDFEDGSDAADWLIVNTNPHQGRGAGWLTATEKTSPAGSNVVQLYVYSMMDGEYDDWIFSPAIDFPSAGEYTLRFSAKGASYDTHKFNIALGTDTSDPESFNIPVVAYNKAKFGSQWTDYDNTFAIEDPGTYHIGFHAQGCDVGTRLNIDNVRVTKASTSGVDDITVTQVEPVGYYNLNGQTIERPASGLVIVRYSDGSARKVLIK